MCIAILFAGCPCGDYSIDILVKNEGYNTIVIACGFEKYNNTYKMGSDTILNSHKGMYDFHIVAPNQVESVVGVFDDEIHDTVTLFFIDKAIYDNCSWDSISNSNLINSRYVIPIQYYIDNYSAKNPLPYPLDNDIGDILILNRSH